MKSKNLRPSELPGDARPRLRHRLEWLAVVCLRGLVRACPLAAVRAARQVVLPLNNLVAASERFHARIARLESALIPDEPA